MIRFGVSGHQDRPDVDWDWVRSEIRTSFREAAGEGEVWSCLAAGADTIAAEEGLDAGLRLMTIIPHAGYSELFRGRNLRTFLHLIAASSSVSHMDACTGEDAYLAAGRSVVDRCDRLLLVWDGRPAAGRGGTGDIADYARAARRKTVWFDTTCRQTRRF